MFHKTNRGVYTSDLFSSIGGLQHGFTTRMHGDMRDHKTIEALLGKDVSFVRAQQVHGGKVHSVTTDTKTMSIIDGVDGLVSVGTSTIPLFLTVRTADCVPVLAVDPKTHIIGIAHAGWKGTVAKIPEHLVREMIILGAKSKDIRVVLGPSIGACCYSVTKDRAKIFSDAFSDTAIGLLEKDGEIFLNLQTNIVDQFFRMGITKSHIETANMCTASLYPEFFSYRKDTKETFGEMLGFVGYQSSI